MPIAECGLKKKTKKSEIRNPKSEITKPMFFPRNARPSGPQACLFEEKKEPGVSKERFLFYFQKKQKML